MKKIIILSLVLAAGVGCSKTSFTAENIGSQSTAPLGSVDNMTCNNGVVNIVGWAADQEDGSAVASIEVFIDKKYVGKTDSRYKRPDVVNAFSNDNFENAGWVLKGKAELSAGKHTVSVLIRDKQGNILYREKNISIK